MIEPISIAIGFGIGAIVVLAFVLIFKRKKKKLETIKKMVQESYEHLKAASEIQRELYKTFNEIEGDIK